jgi:cysteine desulfurase
MSARHASTYLDNAATTQLHPDVLQAMLPWMSEEFGNPSSVHGYGRTARVAVERARAQVAALIGADPAEIVFTSGGSESCNAAVFNALLRSRLTIQRPHVITSPAEHQAVLSTITARDDIDIEMTTVDAVGRPLTASLDQLIRPETALVALMHANNETGAILDMACISDMLQDSPALLFTDMVQTAGKILSDIHRTRIDLAALSAHKLHGPGGIGALYIRRGLDYSPFIRGGAQERGRRGGSEHVAGIVGFGEAARLALQDLEQRRSLWIQQRERLICLLSDSFDGLIINSVGDHVANILSVTFPFPRYPVDGAMLLMNLDLHGVAVSAGSACTAGSIEASHVMRAIGHDDASARSSLRFSFGAFTDVGMIEHAAAVLLRVMTEMLQRSSERSHSRNAMP